MTINEKDWAPAIDFFSYYDVWKKSIIHSHTTHRKHGLRLANALSAKA